MIAGEASPSRPLAIALATLLLLAYAAPSPAHAAVDQIHLSMSNDPSEMAVDFVSQQSSPCTVSYNAVTGDNGHMSPPFAAQQKVTSKIGWHFAEIGYLNQAVMVGLAKNTSYAYTITCSNEAPRTATFVNYRIRKGGLKVAFLADFGLVNDQSMNALVQGAKNDDFDMLILGGDFAYDFWTNNSQVGNDFMNALEPVTSIKPFMPAPGNHEHHDNFTQYYYRFKGVASTAGARSGSGNNFFYSFDYMDTHFVAIDTEIYMFPNETNLSPYPTNMDEQFAWLEKDLAAASKNRQNVPWIVMYGHKAWYMDFEPDSKDPFKSKMVTNFTGFTALADKYKVDAYFAGHVHLYQRFYPLLGPNKHIPDQKPLDVDHASVQDDGLTYKNPKYMTTVIVGSPGDQETTFIGMCPGESVLMPQLRDTFAACEANYGFGVMTMNNATHFNWNWYEIAPGGGSHAPPTQNDEFWIIKDN